ncbi:MAG: hypothetical protein QOG16_180, partial [Actinomycetota bacterium]|nr:hypothetical protein [Actinomycetota bacterium]
RVEEALYQAELTAQDAALVERV